MVEKTTKLIIAVLVTVFLAIIITCVQMTTAVQSGKDSTLRLRSWDSTRAENKFKRDAQHVLLLNAPDLNKTWHLAERFPYVVAVTRNATGLWTFACFATVILVKWIVAAAHCRIAGNTHRVIVFYDYAYNQSHAFPILFWRIHEKYNKTLLSPKYDIAVAKLNMETYSYKLRSAVFDESSANEIESSVWKTVATMDKKLYLTNQFDRYDIKIVKPGKCYESYGIAVDESLICIDTSDFEECFTHDFGPVYSGDKAVGLLVIKPKDCEMKLSIFTNISYYTDWILRTTLEG